MNSVHTVNISFDAAKKIREAYLPRDPSRMRGNPDLYLAVWDFIHAIESHESPKRPAKRRNNCGKPSFIIDRSTERIQSARKSLTLARSDAAAFSKGQALIAGKPRYYAETCESYRNSESREALTDDEQVSK